MPFELDLPPVRSDLTPSPANHASDHNKLRNALAQVDASLGQFDPDTTLQIREAPLSPYRYGLTDDMENDPDAAADVDAAFQATVDAMPPTNGAMLIPRGRWYYDEGMTTSGRQFVIKGHGIHATSLSPIDHAGPNRAAIHVLADTAPNYGSGLIGDMTIGPIASTPNPGVGVKVEGAYAADVLLRDMWVGSMSTGVFFIDAPNCAVSRLVIEACQGAGIYAETCHLLTIDDVQTFQNNASGIHLEGCQSVLTIGGKQIENYGHGLLANGGGGISVVGTMFDNNSKQYAYDPGALTGFDNVHYVGVNEGTIEGTTHVASLGSAFVARGINVDASSYRVDVMGGYVRSGAVAVETIRNLATEGQVITRERVALRSPIRVGTIYLRDNAGVLQASTDGSSWSTVWP